MVKVGKIDVVILCGGLGKRLRPVVNGCPKSMVTINGHPFLDLLISHLSQQGFQRFILCTGYKREFIKEYYQRKREHFRIEFSEEEKPLGTGGAVKKAQPLIQSNPFLVVNGDSFCQFEAPKFLEFHESKDAVGSIVVTKVGEGDDYGLVCLDGSGQVVSFKEKLKAKGARYINAGVYLFQQKVFPLMPEESTFSLEQNFFPEIIGRGFYGYVTPGPLIDIGTPERYRKAKERLKEAIRRILER